MKHERSKKFTSFLLVVAFALTAVTFTSCSKEKKLEKQLRGDWKVSSFESNSSTGAKSFQSDEAQGATTTTIDINVSTGSIVFEEDGSGTYQFDMTIDYTDPTLTYNWAYSAAGTFTWDNTESTVTITYDNGETVTYTFVSSSKDKMVLAGSGTTSVNTSVEISGISINISYYADMTLVK